MKKIGEGEGVEYQPPEEEDKGWNCAIA